MLKRVLRTDVTSATIFLRLRGGILDAGSAEVAVVRCVLVQGWTQRQGRGIVPSERPLNHSR